MRGEDVAPDFGAVNDVTELSEVVGALMTVTLIVAVLMLIVSAVIWAIAHTTGNYQNIARGKAGVLVAIGGGICAGGALAWLRFLLDTGGTL